MDMTVFRQEFQPIFEAVVREHIRDFAASAQDSFLESIGGHVAALTVGGKLLRPYMAMLGYRAGKGKNDALALQLGVALELFHVFCLVHDDIIDKADMRRHTPTLEAFAYARLKAESRRGDLKHVAMSQAILLGDLLFSWSIRHASTAAMASPAPQSVMLEFQAMIDEVVVGQMIDVDTTSRDEHDEGLLERKMYLKTAGYSFVRPLRIGLQLSGSTNTDLLKALSAIGSPMGLAFQLQDDLFDVTSDDVSLGKPTLSDIRTGQQTCLTAFVEKQGSTSDKQLLARVMSGLGSDQDHVKLRECMLNGGAVAAAQTRIAALWRQTEQAILQAGFSTDLLQDYLGLLKLLRARAR